MPETEALACPSELKSAENNELKSAENKESLKIPALYTSGSMCVANMCKPQTQAISLFKQMGNFP